MDMETLGYFIYMDKMEHEAQQQEDDEDNEEREDE